VNVISGDTYGALCGPSSAVYSGSPCTAAPGSVPATPGSPQPQGSGTNYGDADPNLDICSATQDGNSAAGTIQMGGQNIGDLLDHSGTTWGWFQGGFASPSYRGPVRKALAQEIVGVAGLSDDLEPGLGEQARDPLAQQHVILADHHS
jgi:hypothetical protein